MGRFVQVHDFESPCSALSSAKVLDTSSFRRKKLFVLEFEDE